MVFLSLIPILALLAGSVQSAAGAPPADVARRIDYIIFEGGGPDQGPGRDVESNVAALRKRLGPIEPSSRRMYGYGVQQIRVLSRSVAVIAADVESAMDAAEKHEVPVWLHIDPYYAWGADTETRPQDAPAVKFWEHPQMREWAEFPAGEELPRHIPRLWFNWGQWCSPVAAVPAIGSPKFVEFARSQLAEGVLKPLAARLEKWGREGRAHLFAGINIGWETHLPAYPRSWAQVAARQGEAIAAAHPRHLRGLAMDRRIPGLQLGYASLHWRGWDEAKLLAAAKQAGRSSGEQFRQLCYEAIHDYMEALARECHDRGVPADRIYTHIVALATVEAPTTNTPPIWTAVNRFSVPGFTMDNRGAAKYRLATLVEEVANAPGSRRAGFGAVETYVSLAGRTYVTDAETYLKEINELFDAGARVKVVYAAFPLNSGRAPDAAFVGVQKWLAEGRR